MAGAVVAGEGWEGVAKPVVPESSRHWEAEEECRHPGSELVGVHPLVGALVLETHSLHQLVCLRGTSAGNRTGRGT